MNFALFFLFTGVLLGETLTLSLKQAVDLALSPTGSARIQLARQMSEQSRTRAKQARAALLPNVDGIVSGENFTRNLEAFGIGTRIQVLPIPPVVGPLTVFDGRATLTQTIFDFAAIRRWQAAKASAEAVEREEEWARNAVTDQVARAYMAALRAMAAVEAARADVELAEALGELADRLKNAGTGTGIEVVRSEVQLANERQRLLVATNEQRQAHLRLVRAVGLAMDMEIEPSEALTFSPPEPVSLEEAIRIARETRADARAQRQRTAAAHLSYESVRGERYPSISAFGHAGNIGLSLDETRFTRAFGVSMRVPLFDGGRRDARRAEAGITERMERIRAEDLDRQIDMEVRLALEDLESAAAQVKVAEEGLELAGKELAQAQRRYEAGVTTGLEVTDAQARLARARDNCTLALYQHNVAKIDLASAMGVLHRVIQ
jgi:outer membrane protein TolC